MLYLVVTKEVQGLSEQNKVFEKMTNNRFARVHLMAKDIKARIEEEYQEQMKVLEVAEKQKFSEKYGKL